MKHIYLVLLFAFTSVMGYAQGNIDSFTVVPANPTTEDTVYVYVDSWFSSGGCPLDFLGHAVSGSTILAASRHCLGLLTVICNATDTFKIDPLPAGNYTFDLSLLTGALPVPCQTTLVVNDQQSTTFTVTQTVGIENFDLNELVFENPVVGTLRFNKPLTEAIQLFDVTGKQIIQLDAGQSSVDLSGLVPGIYFLQSPTSVRKLLVANTDR